MKRSVFVILASLCTASLASAKVEIESVRDVIAATVYDVNNVPNPEGGMIVFDSKDFVFKGKKWDAGWQTLGSSAVSVNYVSVTTNYGITSIDDILGTTGTLTLTLPSASSIPGKTYEIKKMDSLSTIVTINTTGGDVFDGDTEISTSTKLHSKNDSLKLVSDGSGKWVIINDGRSVVARVGTSSGQTIPNGGTAVIINFNGTPQIDTHSGITAGSNWVYTAPIAGRYLVASVVRYDNGTYNATTNQHLYLYKNGSVYSTLGIYSLAATVTAYPGTMSGSTIVELVAGDTVNLRTTHSEGSSRSLIPSAEQVNVSIVRIK